MASREYSVVLTKAEWVEALLRLHLRFAMYGVIHYWPNHRYAFLEMDRLAEQVSADDAFDTLVRTTPLDVDNAAKDCFDQPTLDGFVHLGVPKISMFSKMPRLTYSSVAIRAEDTLPTLPSPTPLFEAIKKEFKRLVRGNLITRRSGSPVRGLGYTEGALSMFDAGYELAVFLRNPADQIPGGADDVLVPEERWSQEGR